MHTQQVILPPTRAAFFLVLRVLPGREADALAALGEVSATSRAVAFREPEGRLVSLVGIGSEFWDRALGAPRPRHLHPFAGVRGARHVAPATGGDLLLHLRADRHDLCFQAGRLLLDLFGDAVEVAEEVHGFKFFDERDLLGFVDGSANPEGAQATEAVLVDDDGPFTGASYVLTQRYLHDMAAWQRLTIEEQQEAIGRTKSDDVEFPDARKAPSAHTRLAVVHDDAGRPQRILRGNMPFGRLGDGESGTYFIGYAKDPAVLEEMLRKMFVGEPEGTTDRLLDFSTAQSGGLFFVPTLEQLAGLAHRAPVA